MFDWLSGLFVERPKGCKWCGEALIPGAMVCSKCNLPQGNVYHPTPRLFGALLTIAAFPFAAWLYELYDSRSDNQRKALDHKAAEQQTLLQITGDWQPLDDSLKADCLPEHVADARACLADYTARLMSIDAFVAKTSWSMSAVPFKRETLDSLTSWKELWWNQTRNDLKKAYRALAFDGDKKLLACQADFETSECMIGIDSAMKDFRDRTLKLFCAVLLEVEDDRLALAKTMGGSVGAKEVDIWAEQRERSTCYSIVRHGCSK